MCDKVYHEDEETHSLLPRGEVESSETPDRHYP